MNFRIAVPSKKGVPLFDLHECTEISIVDVYAGRIEAVQIASFDSKDPDRIARQLDEMGINILITGGIRPDILERLNRSSINLVTSAHGKTVDGLVAAFLDGSLFTPSHTDRRRPAE